MGSAIQSTKQSSAVSPSHIRTLHRAIARGTVSPLNNVLSSEQTRIACKLGQSSLMDVLVQHFINGAIMHLDSLAFVDGAPTAGVTALCAELTAALQQFTVSVASFEMSRNSQ